jgi:hypothetical protein
MWNEDWPIYQASIRNSLLIKPLEREHTVIIVKGKAISLQAWTGREDSRSLRLTDFKTIDT